MGAVLAVALKEYGSNQALQAVAAFYGRGVASTSSANAATGRQDAGVPRLAPSTSAGAESVAGAEPVEATIAFNWVTIPAGKFWMGSNKARDSLAFDNELPRRKVDLPTYRIARYPVTVAQFEQFVKATNYKTTAEQRGSAWNYQKGKDEWDWVEIKGAFWAHPLGPDSHVQDKANHPVICVSWDDATAFCRWVTTILRAAGQGIEVRLPSEAEWEKAARASSLPDGSRSETVRIYPWGNEAPDKERCNFNMNEGDTTPVDRYHKSKSFYDVLDMAGNVWEWTSSLYEKYPYNSEDGREDPAGGGRRVVRGGSFRNPQGSVRSARRVYVDADLRYFDVGFRVLALAVDPLASVASGL